MWVLSEKQLPHHIICAELPVSQVPLMLLRHVVLGVKIHNQAVQFISKQTSINII